jgi:hypothetical protein
LEPWAFHLVMTPSAFFEEAGLSRPGLAVAGLRPASLLLLSPGRPGLPPVWVTAGLVLPAFGALLARRRMALVYAGWSVALAGLVLALVVSRVRVTPPQGGPAVSAWPGIALAIAAAGLLLAAAPLIETAGRPLRQAADLITGRVPRTDWRVLVTLASFAVGVSAPVLAAGYWLAAGAGGTVTAASPQILPAFVAATSTGPNRNRTLVLRQVGATLSYAVLRDTDPVLGEPELTTEPSSSTHALASVVASLAAAGSGDAGDTGQALSQFDLGYVLLPAPVDQPLAQQLDAAAGLEPLTKSGAYDLWQVSGTVARARVVAADGTVVPVASGSIGVNTVLAPGTSGTLVLAEASGGWSATLNGKPLASPAQPVDGWAQGFMLPAGGGRLVVSRDETARDVSLGIEAVALIVAFVLALPGTRSAAPAAAEVRADSEATPAQGRRERAASTRAAGSRAASTRTVGTRAARRRRRPQFSPADAQAITPADAHVRDADDTAASVAAAEPAFASSGSASAQAPFTLAAPAGSPLSPAPSGPAPMSPAPDPEFPPRRGHGQHAARHGKAKPARRWRANNDKPAPPTAQPPTSDGDGR